MFAPKSTYEISDAALKAKTAKRVAKFERDDASEESGDYSVRVREPTEGGYHLTHITILASCPMPQPTDRALSRLIILGMESIFSGSITHLTVKQQRSDRNPASIKAFTARSNAKWNPVELVKRKLVKTARILFCNIYSVAFPTDWHQRHHNSLPRHKANVAAANAKAEAKAAVEPEFEPGWKKEFDE
ncbi:hypothetical protein B0T13DRAFT_491178 [Neurospora crassa]|nr:hypothetical protein B0T13DRAFT_491178 [Neurospora crassa]